MTPIWQPGRHSLAVVLVGGTAIALLASVFLGEGMLRVWFPLSGLVMATDVAFEGLASLRRIRDRGKSWAPRLGGLEYLLALIAILAITWMLALSAVRYFRGA